MVKQNMHLLLPFYRSVESAKEKQVKDIENSPFWGLNVAVSFILWWSVHGCCNVHYILQLMLRLENLI